MQGRPGGIDGGRMQGRPGGIWAAPACARRWYVLVNSSHSRGTPETHTHNGHLGFPGHQIIPNGVGVTGGCRWDRAFRSLRDV